MGDDVKNNQNVMNKLRRSTAYKNIKTDLMKQLKDKGNDSPVFTNLIEDYLNLWCVKELLLKDIEERGVYIEWRNSDTQYSSKKNDSVQETVKVNNQMLKILQQLKLEVRTVPIIETTSDDDEL